VVPEHPGGRAAATGPQPGPAKMEKMEKNVLRMEEIIVRMEEILIRMDNVFVKVEEILVYSWQDWSCYLEAVSRGLSSGHKERALRCFFRSEINRSKM
jgi:hypothetical protein